MTLDVRSAAILLECARRGSLGRAAAALDMTQPAVTRTIQQLEASYGVTLFERTTRGVLPTAYGEALLPYAQLVVSEVGNADDVIRQMRGASRGVLRVGGVASVVGGFLTSAIGRMLRDHPDVQFQIVEELEDRLLDGLKEGAIDIAISPEPYADDEITRAAPETLHDTVSAFARSGHPLAGSDRVSLQEAAMLDWSLPPAGTPVVREWLRRFHAAGLEPRTPCLVSRSAHVITSAVLTQDIVCWMPLPLVRAEVERGDIVRLPIAELDWRRTFHLYRRKKGLMTPTASILVSHLAALGRETANELI